MKNSYISIIANFIYAIENCIIGFFAHSWWFITVGTHYVVLTATRYSVLKIRPKSSGNYETELFSRRITGILLIVLSFCIVGLNILSALKESGTAFHEIIMIAIATYTFTKITIAITKMVKAKRTTSPALKTLRNISLADACVSIYTMQGQCSCPFLRWNYGNSVTKYFNGNCGMDRCTTSRNQSDWRKIYRYG